MGFCVAYGNKLNRRACNAAEMTALYVSEKSFTVYLEEASDDPVQDVPLGFSTHTY